MRELTKSKRTWTFQSQFAREFRRKMPGPSVRPERRHTLCASLRSRNALGHFTSATLCENLKAKCRGPNPRRTFCASLRNRIAFQHVTKATLHRNLQVKGRRPRASKTRAANFVRACAIEMHLEISQEPLYAKISRKNVGVQVEHPDQALAFTLTVRTPQCGRTVWGTYHKNPSVWTHCLGAVETHVKISQDSRSARQDLTRATLHGNSPIKCRRPKPCRRLCASLRSRNACQDFTRATLYTNLQVKCRRPKPRCRLCASLRSRNACQDFTRATSYRNLQVNAAAQSEHPDQAPAFTLTVRTPQCGHTVWGKMGIVPCHGSRMSASGRLREIIVSGIPQQDLSIPTHLGSSTARSQVSQRMPQTLKRWKNAKQLRPAPWLAATRLLHHSLVLTSN